MKLNSNSKYRRILFILGTRPEAIKLSPLIIKFNNQKEFEVKVCNTGQHKELIDAVFNFFEIKPDFNLNVMKSSDTLAELTSNCLSQIDIVLEKYKPDLVFVQGDTISAFSGALAAFYRKIKIAHVEAGLRSDNRFSPFPEEINRVFISKIADYHFAPTDLALRVLKNEGVSENLWNVGNTVVDALLMVDKIKAPKKLIKTSDMDFLIPNKKIILITFHRRENFGKPLIDFCRVINDLIKTYKDIQIVYPVHPNPNVRKVINQELVENERLSVIEPLPYFKLIYLMKKSFLILTDSGGIQEEAPAFGKPVVVLREVTERMEGIHSGNAVLGGNSYSRLWPIIRNIIDDEEVYTSMSRANNPYGDGTASEKIYHYIKTNLITPYGAR